MEFESLLHPSSHCAGRSARSTGGALRRLPRGLAPLGRLALAGAGAVCLAAAASAAPQAEKPDQVFRVDSRSGKVVAVSGTVEVNALDRVLVKRRDGTEARFDPAEVVDVTFGAVPQSYTDAMRYLERKDYENSVARFRVAASDSATRPVVQANARLQAARALLAFGGEDPTRFAEAAEEAGNFVASFADSRDVPAARVLQARALVLAGKPAEGAALYEAVHQAGQSGTAGYGRMLTLEAGLQSAFAFLAAGNPAEARRMFDALGNALASAPTAGLDSATAARIAAIGEVAGLGQGFVQLSEGHPDRAEPFFRGKVDSLQTGAGKNAARLGLGEALLALSRAREAQIELARASALAYTNADVEARAMLGLGQAYLALGDPGEAKKTFERVRRIHGVTPAAARAAEHLKSF